MDFHTAMKDQRDGLPETLSRDGVHPRPAGYAVMTPLVETGIEKALTQYRPQLLNLSNPPTIEGVQERFTFRDAQG